MSFVMCRKKENEKREKKRKDYMSVVGLIQRVTRHTLSPNRCAHKTENQCVMKTIDISFIHYSDVFLFSNCQSAIK